MASGPITSWEIDGETVETVSDFIFLGSKITADGDCGHEIKRRLLLGRKVMTNLESIFKSRDITLPTKVRLVKTMVFLWSCIDVRVELWRRLSAEELMLLNCGVGEDSWESLGLQEIQPVHPKGDQSWGFIGRTDVEAETPILWPPAMKNWLIWKDPDAGKYWWQEKGGWHHQLNGYEFEWTPGGGDGQGGLMFCSPWGYKESDKTERLNWAVENCHRFRHFFFP